MNQSYNIPILLIIFKRLNTTKQLLTILQQIKPRQLFIAADGPRPNVAGEDEQCNIVRKYVVENINWDCKVETLFHDINLGCGKAPAQAITWFFKHIDMGIILEDDCLPNLSFFKFMEELLNKYKDDTRIMQISGTNRLIKFETSNSYVFTNWSSEWGWATWRRAWKYYDFNIKFFIENKNKTINILKYIYYKEHWYNSIYDILMQTVNNPNISWWDYQWGFIKNINSGLTIIPKYNLVANIGFDEDSTHTFDKTSSFFNMPCFELEYPLIHPDYIHCDIDYDLIILEKHFPSPPKASFFSRIKKIIKRIIWKK